MCPILSDNDKNEGELITSQIYSFLCPGPRTEMTSGEMFTLQSHLEKSTVQGLFSFIAYERDRDLRVATMTEGLPGMCEVLGTSTEKERRGGLREPGRG